MGRCPQETQSPALRLWPGTSWVSGRKAAQLVHAQEGNKETTKSSLRSDQHALRFLFRVRPEHTSRGPSPGPAPPGLRAPAAASLPGRVLPAHRVARPGRGRVRSRADSPDSPAPRRPAGGRRQPRRPRPAAPPPEGDPWRGSRPRPRGLLLKSPARTALRGAPAPRCAASTCRRPRRGASGSRQRGLGARLQDSGGAPRRPRPAHPGPWRSQPPPVPFETQVRGRPTGSSRGRSPAAHGFPWRLRGREPGAPALHLLDTCAATEQGTQPLGLAFAAFVTRPPWAWGAPNFTLGGGVWVRRVPWPGHSAGTGRLRSWADGPVARSRRPGGVPARRGFERRHVLPQGLPACARPRGAASTPGWCAGPRGRGSWRGPPEAEGPGGPGEPREAKVLPSPATCGPAGGGRPALAPPSPEEDLLGLGLGIPDTHEAVGTEAVQGDGATSGHLAALRLSSFLALGAQRNLHVFYSQLLCSFHTPGRESTPLSEHGLRCLRGIG